VQRIRATENFPLPVAIAALRAEGVRYLVVHEAYYRDPSAPGFVLETLHQQGLRPVTRLHDGGGYAVVFELQ
jgi:hypothetical protein